MKETIVMKFGGASVKTPENFHQIASIIANRKQIEKKPIVVVLSAMANTTDELFNLARQVHPNPPHRELDMLVSVGERISIALLAMALSLKGIDAISLTGSQSGIITDESHNEAKIIQVKPQRILSALASNQVVIVAGFQGVSRKGEITTLGRGGSDTSAVAMAVALKSPCVDFYKDVPGLYNMDPKVHLDARLLASVGYEEASFLANKGAKVLHPRSVFLAEKNGVQMKLRSFLKPDAIGTLIGNSTLSAEALWE
ncbi:MAG TPA: aspartate kinase [Chlamydiales bacterium]|jgi:aspartate kinase